MLVQETGKNDERRRSRLGSPPSLAPSLALLTGGAGAVTGVVAAEDRASALRDREVRTCNRHNRLNDRPLGAAASPTSNRLCRGSWVRGRRRSTQIAYRAAAI